MKKYGSEQLRNVALIAHGGAGKTSLAEALLFDSGVTDRLGKVDDGTSTLDYEPEEVKRRISLSCAVAPCEWGGAKLNIIDTPGFADFVGEVKSGLRVADAAVVVFSAVAGVEVGSENVWGFADELNLPRIAFITKMDRENADFYKALDSIVERFGSPGRRIVPLTIPVGAQDSFSGLVDIIRMKALVYKDGTSGKFEEVEIPMDLKERASSYRDALLEAAAENDDELIEKYLEGEELSEDEIRRGLAKGVKSGKMVPVFCGSGVKNIGAQPLLDAIVSYFPSPVEVGPVEAFKPGSDEIVTVEPDPGKALAAFVFKTTADPYVGKLTLFRLYSGTLRPDSQVYNSTRDRMERIGQPFYLRGKHQEPASEIVAGDIAAVAKLVETGTGDTLCERDKAVVFKGIDFPSPTLSMAVHPKSKGDEEKISAGLARLCEEDPTFKVEKQTETGETIISGMGDQHLDVIADRLKRKFGVDVTLSTPKVPYRETIRSSVKVEGKYKKQTGGRGQYGHVWLEISPLPAGSEFEFVDNIFGGAVPRQYIPAVEKGVREALSEGVLAGYPMVDVKVSLYDGSYHPVDSSEMAFKIAASMALKKGAMDAHPVLLEPIMSVEVVVPEAFMGDVMGDLNKRRGKILGMEPAGGNQVIKAVVPMAEMFKYATDLRSITGGRGSFSMSFSHYEEVPAQISAQIVEAAKKEKEKEA